MTYTESHIAPGKGIEYDALYRTNEWERYSNRRERSVVERIARELRARGPVNYLDFACGTGRITCMVEHLVDSSTAVDVSESMVREARAKLKRTRIILHNVLEDDLLGKERFQLITAFRFFVNAEPPLRASAMNYLAGKLGAGGLFLFNIHQNSRSFHTRLDAVSRRVRHVEPLPLNYWSVGEANQMLLGCGLGIKKMFSVGFLRIPRFPIRSDLYSLVDRIASRSRRLVGLSSGPVIVAARE